MCMPTTNVVLSPNQNAKSHRNVVVKLWPIVGSDDGARHMTSIKRDGDGIPNLHCDLIPSLRIIGLLQQQFACILDLHSACIVVHPTYQMLVLGASGT